MPRTRKPQVARPAGRVASTTTWATKNVPSPVVYRIPTGRRDIGCEWQVVGAWVAPIHVRWIDEHEFQVSINEAELKWKIEQWENLNLSNVEVTLSEVNWPLTVTGNLNVEDGTLTVDEATITTLTSTTGTIDGLTSTTWNITTLTATDIDSETLDASGNVTVGWTLWVTGDATLDANLSVGWNSSITGNEAITGTLDVTGATTVTELSASTSITTVDLTVTGDATLADVTSGDVSANSITTTEWATIWTTLDVTWDATLWEDLSVTGNETVWGTLDVTWASTFTGAVSTDDITSTGTATLNDVTVGWNESVTGTLWVTGAATLSSTLTVAGASTLSGNTAVGWNLTVAGSSTFTGNGIFNENISVGWNETITGNATVGWTLWVTGDVTLTDDLTVNWTTSLWATETGALDVTGTARISWAAVIGNGAVVTGQVESDTVRTDEVITDEVRITNGLYLSAWAEAPDFILQVEKGQPGGVAVLGIDWIIPAAQLPAIFTTCILKIVEVVFDNSTTAVLRDPDIMLSGSQWLSNYQDIVWDIDPTIHEGEIILVSNEVETGSVHVNIAYPVDRCAQLAQNNQSGWSTTPVPDADLSNADPLP